MTARRQYQDRKKRYNHAAAPVLFSAYQILQTPKKQTRPKRKRTGALAEISSNVPRGGNRRLARNTQASDTKIPRLKSDDGEDGSEVFPSSLGGFRHGHDVFCDGDGATGILSALGSRSDILTGAGPYDGRPFTPPGQDQK